MDVLISVDKNLTVAARMKRLAHQGLQKVIKKCYRAVNVINGFTLHPIFSQVCGNSGNQIIVRHYFEGKVAGWLCTAGSWALIFEPAGLLISEEGCETHCLE